MEREDPFYPANYEKSLKDSDLLGKTKKVKKNEQSKTKDSDSKSEDTKQVQEPKKQTSSKRVM